MAELQILTQVTEGVAEIRLLGEMDSYSAPRVRRLLNEKMAGEKPSVFLRLSELEYIDSVGLGVLVAALKRATDRSGTLVLVAPSPTVARVLKITGLDMVFTVLPLPAEQGTPTVPH